jgi:hypothetical protein
MLRCRKPVLIAVQSVTISASSHVPEIAMTSQRTLAYLCLFALFGAVAGCRSTHVRTSTEFAEHGSLQGVRIVLVEPEIQLYELKASGMPEPRADWSRAAQQRLPQIFGDMLRQKNAILLPDYRPPVDMPPEHRIRQVLALNQAVMSTIFLHSYLHMPLPTRGAAHKKPLSWTLGPGVEEIRRATGADYMLYVYVQDTYASTGRVAMMLLGLALQVAILNGGQQAGIATMVDLRTGDVVWFNVLVDQLGDLRDPEGARDTARHLLKGLPL